MRKILILCAMLLAGGSVGTPAMNEGGAAIVAKAVPLNPRDPARTRIGGLAYLGGWVLTSADRRFGGISALAGDGEDLIALGDRGGIFRISPRGNLPPAGRVIGMLPDGPAGRGRDSESLARGPGGAYWVGFEGANAIWRYDPGLGRATGHVAPAVMAGWPRNGGPEALVRLADGRFLVFSEEAKGRVAGSRAALMFAGDPVAGARADRFDYVPPDGYVVTDAQALPDGRMIVLHRRFTLMDGVSAVISIVDLAAVRPGAVVRGREIARLASPMTVDNMEALAITRDARGAILWIASDDNFSSIQRTLLLRFRLDKETAPEAGR